MAGKAAVIILGIDVGLSGAIATVRNGHDARVEDLPTVACGKGRRICGRALILLIRELVPADGAAHAFIEDIHAGMGPGSLARASIMRSRGIVEAVLDIARIPVTALTTSTWKRHFGLIKAEKRESLEVARRLYPGAADRLKRAKDHNRAESMLLAHYGAEVHA
jgi:hypothetical protein